MPVKEGPLAVKHIYTPETLAKVQKSEKPIPAAPATAAIPAVKPPSTSAETSGKKPPVLLAQRRRFGVDWSWPSAGAVIEKFSESNKGINIAGKTGAPVYAGADGKVVYVGTGVKSYGRLVIIKHANDYLSAYAHNQTILVGEGDKVKRGQKIATLGDSGAPMPMLHFEIRKAGKPFDPLRVLPKL
ncbi:MAG: peptidoglycan DD-metalloendopeptidase family protein [Gammaproteobacteria bacterium]